MFANRTEAAELLAKRLRKYAGTNGIVLGIPRGGIPIAHIVAERLHLPLDIVLTKKIGHPFNKEYAIGAVGLADRYVIPHDDVSDEYIERTTDTVRARLREMQALYKNNQPMQNIAGKKVIVVDDGIATGNTLLVTIRMLRKQQPQEIIVAVPVSSEQAYEKLSREADECICLRIPDFFTGVGAYYEDFSEVTDEMVQQIMQNASTNAAHKP